MGLESRCDFQCECMTAQVVRVASIVISPTARTIECTLHSDLALVCSSITLHGTICNAIFGVKSCECYTIFVQQSTCLCLYVLAHVAAPLCVCRTFVSIKKPSPKRGQKIRMKLAVCHNSTTVIVVPGMSHILSNMRLAIDAASHHDLPLPALNQKFRRKHPHRIVLPGPGCSLLECIPFRNCGSNVPPLFSPPSQ